MESSLDWTRQSFSSIRSIDDNGRHTTTTTSLVISFIRGHFSKEEKNDGRSQRSYLLTRISEIYIYISRTSLCVLRRRSIAVRQLDRDQTREGERVSFRSRYLSYPPMQSYRSFSIFSAIRIIDETIRAVKKKNTCRDEREDDPFVRLHKRVIRSSFSRRNAQRCIVYCIGGCCHGGRIEGLRDG